MVIPGQEGEQILVSPGQEGEQTLVSPGQEGEQNVKSAYECARLKSTENFPLYTVQLPLSLV